MKSDPNNTIFWGPFISVSKHLVFPAVISFLSKPKTYAPPPFIYGFAHTSDFFLAACLGLC